MKLLYGLAIIILVACDRPTPPVPPKAQPVVQDVRPKTPPAKPDPSFAERVAQAAKVGLPPETWAAREWSRHRAFWTGVDRLDSEYLALANRGVRSYFVALYFESAAGDPPAFLAEHLGDPDVPAEERIRLLQDVASRHRRFTGPVADWIEAAVEGRETSGPLRRAALMTLMTHLDATPGRAKVVAAALKESELLAVASAFLRPWIRSGENAEVAHPILGELAAVAESAPTLRRSAAEAYSWLAVGPADERLRRWSESEDPILRFVGLKSLPRTDAEKRIESLATSSNPQDVETALLIWRGLGSTRDDLTPVVVERAALHWDRCKSPVALGALFDATIRQDRSDGWKALLGLARQDSEGLPLLIAAAAAGSRPERQGELLEFVAPTASPRALACLALLGFAKLAEAILSHAELKSIPGAVPHLALYSGNSALRARIEKEMASPSPSVPKIRSFEKLYGKAKDLRSILAMWDLERGPAQEGDPFGYSILEAIRAGMAEIDSDPSWLNPTGGAGGSEPRKR